MDSWKPHNEFMPKRIPKHCSHVSLNEVTRIDCGRYFYVQYKCAYCAYIYHSIEPKEIKSILIN